MRVDTLWKMICSTADRCSNQRLLKHVEQVLGRKLGFARSKSRALTSSTKHTGKRSRDRVSPLACQRRQLSAQRHRRLCSQHTTAVRHRKCGKPHSAAWRVLTGYHWCSATLARYLGNVWISKSFTPASDGQIVVIGLQNPTAQPL